MPWDAEVKGFALRITPGGAKSFLLDYRAEGRRRRITIGAWPDRTVAAARQTAKGMRREVDLGHDRMSERQTQRGAPTVQEMWERYAPERLPKKAERSQADERMMWSKIILPRFRAMVIWCLIERACFSRDSAVSRPPTTRVQRLKREGL